MGDTMVIITGSDGSDLAAGTEMGHTYADVSKEYEECKKFLASYGFDYESSLCHTQKDTSNKIKKRWTGLIKTLHSRGMANAPVALETYLKITDDLEATHCHPATEKPRLQLRLANHKLMEVCHYRNNHWNLSRPVDPLFGSLGPRIHNSAILFESKHWGFVEDHTVLGFSVPLEGL